MSNDIRATILLRESKAPGFLASMLEMPGMLDFQWAFRVARTTTGLDNWNDGLLGTAVKQGQYRITLSKKVGKKTVTTNLTDLLPIAEATAFFEKMAIDAENGTLETLA